MNNTTSEGIRRSTKKKTEPNTPSLTSIPKQNTVTVQHHHRPPQPSLQNILYTLQTLASTPHGTLSPEKKIQEQEVEPAHNAQYKIILSAQRRLDRLIHFFPISVVCLCCIWPLHPRMALGVKRGPHIARFFKPSPTPCSCCQHKQMLVSLPDII